MHESQDLSTHALHRGAQRSVSAEEIELAQMWGRPIIQGDGRTAYHLGDREAAEAAAKGEFVPAHAVGVAVVVAGDGCVVTVIRSSDRHRLRVHGRRPRPNERRRGQR